MSLQGIDGLHAEKGMALGVQSHRRTRELLPVSGIVCSKSDRVAIQTVTQHMEGSLNQNKGHFISS
jgi:hypothetical protein